MKNSRVRIVNGEVVRENVATSRGSPASSGAPSTNSANVSASGSGGRIATLFEDTSSSTPSSSSSTTPFTTSRPPPATPNGGFVRTSVPAAAGTGNGLIDQLAVTLGVQGQHFLIPPVPALNWNTSVQVPQVYFYLGGILVLISMLLGLKMEMRILIIGGIALGVYVHTHQNNNNNNNNNNAPPRPGNGGNALGR